MAIDRSHSDFSFITARLQEVQASLREQSLGGWLLYDMRARNPVAGKLLGLGELSRRYFVLIPPIGEPVALTHGIEQGPWSDWPWRKEKYVGWSELDDALRALLAGAGTVAMEVSETDAVPVTDLVPYGVVQLVRGAGAQVVSSADLITLFYSRWSAEDETSHRRAAVICAQVAHAALYWVGQQLAAGSAVSEGQLHDRVLADLGSHGLPVDADCIAATGLNAADPHYGPVGEGARFSAGDVVLLDLWARESTAGIYADQTWMGYLGATVPARAAVLFGLVCSARDAAIRHLQSGWSAGRRVSGAEVDDVARGVISAAGYGPRFIHRTGHSIDRTLHGSGPNIDNLETRETRLLLPGIGFSIEPGIYLPGELGVRTEINVYMTADGPEVTTPQPQDHLLSLLP